MWQVSIEQANSRQQKMVNVVIIHTNLGIIGNLTSFIRLAAPLPTIIRHQKKKSVEKFKYHPYIAAIINCFLWVFYSMPFVHPHRIPVTTVNGLGLIMNLAFLITYMIYTTNTKRAAITLYLSAEFLILALLSVVTLLLFHGHTPRSNFVGIFCDIFGIAFYGAPLVAMRNVIETKSVEFMPLSLSLTGFVNGIVWSAYSILRFDLYLLINNGFGALISTLQLILYAIYYKSTPKEGQNSSQVQPSSGRSLELATAGV